MRHAEKAPDTEGITISWARYYDAVTWLMTFGQIGRIRRQIIAAAGPKPGEKALDVGCGTGSLALALKKRVGAQGEVHGIDASPEMIEVARNKADRRRADVDFRVALIEKLPFEDGTFDLVTSTLMLHHLPADLKRQGLAEVRRVLKPGGRLFIADLRSQNHSFVGHIVSMLPGGRHGGPPGHGHTRSTAGELQSVLSEAGFGTVEDLPAPFGQLMFLRARP